MSKQLSKKAIQKELKKRVAELQASQTSSFQLQEFCFDKQLAFINDPARFKTAVCSRRCLAEGTLVQTVDGPKPIENIKAGDWVYSETGAPIQVKAVYANGPKEVVALMHNSRIMVEATLDHVFLTTNTYKSFTAEKAVRDFNSRDKVTRIEVNRAHGKRVPTAYALGALLGDGCSRQGSTNRLYISSGTLAVPAKVAAQLKCELKKNSGFNHTWGLQTGTGPAFYNEWCAGKYAYEKIANAQEVLTWDRTSRLEFFAGLLDTDGCVTNASDGLQIRIGMQAKSVIETAQLLFLDLWGYAPTIGCDNRAKYKNGPVWNLIIKHNYFSQKALLELDQYLVSPQKKWKFEYSDKLQNNYRSDRVGVVLGPTRICNTYDIHVDSFTNLYMLANGFVTHNSGKSIACVADLLHTAMTLPGDVLYLTLNRRSAKRIIWREMLKLDKQFGINAKVDNTELTLTLPNKNVIHLSGAKDEGELEKLRGMALRKVYIDECQGFRPYIKDLVEDIIEPALTDYYGSLILIGTPGPIPAGYFYETSHSPGWSHHHWTMQDNPHIRLKSGKDPREIIQELATRRGLHLDSPSILREYFGKWVKDVDSLVYQFNPEKNIYVHELPDDLVYVFGVDIGYRDADAIAVLGYSPANRCVYLVHEYVKTKQDITSLVTEIKSLKDKYDPVKIVMDAGALGKKIQEEIRLRHSLHTEAAEKTRKAEFITLLNDDLRTGKLMTPAGSRFEEDSYLLQWDLTAEHTMKVSSAYHSDISDSVLYAWRECRHFYERDAVKTRPNPTQYIEELEAKEAEAMEAQKNRDEEFTDVNDWNDLGISDYDDFE